MMSRRVSLPILGFLLAPVFLDAAPNGPVRHLRVADGDVAFTLVGQVTNSPPDRSIQYGYIPTIEGLAGLFSSPTESEATAFFTFFNETRTIATRRDGPLTIVERHGTATIFVQSAPHGSFGDSNSFKDGEPIAVLDLKQQVILDTGTKLFTVVISETVTDSNVFEKDGLRYDLASRGDKFRISFTGVLNATPPPSGFFSGYAVRIGRALGLEAGDRD